MINILYNAELEEPYKHISNMHQIALNLVDEYFSNKKDKGDNDYRYHLWDVSRNLGEYASTKCMNKYSSLGIYYNKAFIVALLHDIFEDTELTKNELIKKGIDDLEIINALILLTKQKEQKYFDYIKQIYNDDIARIVKIFDLENNMDLRRLSLLTNKDLERINKYWWSWKYLKQEIDQSTAYHNIYKQQKNT